MINGLIPILPVTVNQGHPLAQGLAMIVMPIAGQMIEILSGFVIPLVGTASVISTPAGLALNSPSGQNGALVTFPSNTMWGASETTILWRGAFTATPTGGAAVLFGLYSPANTGAYIGILTGQSLPATDIAHQTNRGTQYGEVASSVGINSTFRDVVCTVGRANYSNQPTSIYENGQMLGIGDTSAWANLVAGDVQVLIGYLPGFARSTFGQMALGMIWNRALTPTEVRILYENPLAMLQTVRSYKGPKTAGPPPPPALTLAGTANW